MPVGVVGVPGGGIASFHAEVAGVSAGRLGAVPKAAV